jgi:hypothetical protein
MGDSVRHVRTDRSSAPDAIAASSCSGTANGVKNRRAALTCIDTRQLMSRPTHRYRGTAGADRSCTPVTADQSRPTARGATRCTTACQTPCPPLTPSASEPPQTTRAGTSRTVPDALASAARPRSQHRCTPVLHRPGHEILRFDEHILITAHLYGSSSRISPHFSHLQVSPPPPTPTYTLSWPFDAQSVISIPKVLRAPTALHRTRSTSS